MSSLAEKMPSHCLYISKIRLIEDEKANKPTESQPVSDLATAATLTNSDPAGSRWLKRDRPIPHLRRTRILPRSGNNCKEDYRICFGTTRSQLLLRITCERTMFVEKKKLIIGEQPILNRGRRRIDYGERR